MEHTFTDSNFENDVLKSDVPVLVDFWAEWCTPCKVMGPVIEEAANEIDGAKMKIGKLNVDDNQATSMKYGIMSIPSLYVFKNGAIVDKFVGGMPKAVLIEKLSKHFA